MVAKKDGELTSDQFDSIADVVNKLGWYFSPTHQIQAALLDRQIPPIVESRLSKVIASCKKAKNFVINTIFKGLF